MMPGAIYVRADNSVDFAARLRAAGIKSGQSTLRDAGYEFWGFSDPAGAKAVYADLLAHDMRYHHEADVEG